MDPSVFEGLLKAIRDAVAGPRRDEDLVLPPFDPDKNDTGAETWCAHIESISTRPGMERNYNSGEGRVTLPPSGTCRDAKSKNMMRTSDETIDRTDGESSYSSFNSSFFKTDSGSADDSGDMKKGRDKMRPSTSEFWDKKSPDDQSSMEATSAYYEPKQHKKVTRRKMEPPWMEQVCVTSELIYKYQILTKTLEEVLSADKQKMSNFVQPSLVNEQLGQLYLDLQLEGKAATLTFQEGITSSNSSGEETSTNVPKVSKRKREYSKLVMIYEEDAPLPLPPRTTRGPQRCSIPLADHSGPVGAKRSGGGIAPSEGGMPTSLCLSP